MPDSNYKTVLMAGDDPEDCMPASHAFAESGANAAFSCVADGIALMDYLAVVILTSSQEQEDVDFTLKAGAKSFITKPATFDKW